MDFEIDEKLLNFDKTVPPELGNMNDKAQDYIKRNKRVASTASACGSELTGNYKSDNVGKAVKAFMELSSGCNRIAESLEEKLVPILDECSKLADLIVKLKELATKGLQLIQTIGQLETEIAAAAANEQPTGALEAELAKARADLTETKALFDAKHNECKAKLASLQGKDATIPNMNPTNGSLSYMPEINVDVQAGNAGLKGEYYNYSMPDQSISSISSN